MNLTQARNLVQVDLHMKDLLEELRRELFKNPKPTIGELSSILAKRTIDDIVNKGRLKQDTTPNLYETDFKSYFSILWIIIVENYPELLINECCLLDNDNLSAYIAEFKMHCRKEYTNYIESL